MQILAPILKQTEMDRQDYITTLIAGPKYQLLSDLTAASAAVQWLKGHSALIAYKIEQSINQASFSTCKN